ncbi:MAG TPA: MFS transporter [Spirochaetota bacterium]|nr:MFS transporter [Spirochaetota bacterium]
MENPILGRTGTLDFASKAALFMLACTTIVTPICLVNIGSELQISLASRGGLETARTIPLIVTILVSGIITGKISTKLLITSGLWLMTAGLLLMGLSRTYPAAVVAMVILGAGGGFIEALINPLVTNLHPDNPELHLNTAHAFFSIGICISVLLFGELLSRGLSWRMLYIISCIGTLGTGILFQLAHFPVSASEHFSGKVYLRILKKPVFWIFFLSMFLSTGAEGGLTFWTASFIKSYYSDVPRLWAFGTALFGCSMAAGRMTVGRLSARIPLKTILIATAFTGILVSALIAYTTSLWVMLVLIFAAGLCTSPFWPSILALASKRIHTNTTAVFTLLISSGIGGFAAFPWLIGAIADHTGLRGGFFTIPLLFLLIIPLLVLMKPEKS